MKCERCGKDVKFLIEDHSGKMVCWECFGIKDKDDDGNAFDTFKPFGGYGWVCPRCGKVNAPWKSECDCVPLSVSSPTVNIQYTDNTNSE